MKEFKLLVNKNLKIGKVEDEMFSSFIEHLGRAVYGGIYEPTHESADEDGFRHDVIDVIKPLNLSLVRYPGGNFVSGYFWEDGIGPRENRPQRIEDAWHSIEPNIIGTDEFMIWAKKVGVMPMMALNLGNGTVDSALNLVKYCNLNDDSKYPSMRRKYGSKEPYNIKYWCLGNEMDGDWQIGHMPVDKYVEKAKETAKRIREITPDAKLIACGSSTIDMPTFPSWDRTVLEGLYDEVDYLSVHQYFCESTTEDDYFASHLAINKYIDALRATLNYVKVVKKGTKDIFLCFDEYNIWYNTGKLEEDYKIAPPILEEYQSLKDTIVFGGVLNSLLNNCDIVKVACLAQLVNVIAPIMTQNNGKVLLNGIYYPFEQFCKNSRGECLKVLCVKDETFNSRYGIASYLSSSIVLNNKNELVVNLTNYAKEESKVEIELSDFNELELIKHMAIFGDDLSIRNSFKQPNNIVIQELNDRVSIENKKIVIKLLPLSWNSIIFKL